MNILKGTIYNGESLTGQLSPISYVSGKINEKDSMDGQVIIPKTVDVPGYYGEYTIIPKAYAEQTMETKGKRMLDDVTIKEVPYYEVSNDDGGETVYIANEV